MLLLSEPTNIVENGCDVGMKCMWSHACPIIPKARLEVFVGAKILVLNNFRRLGGYGWRAFQAMKSWFRQNKGHEAEVKEFIERVRGGGPLLIPFRELEEVTQLCFDAVRNAACRSRTG